MTTMEVNRPDVVREVTALCKAYDHALLNNNVEDLNRFFWDDARAMRIGVAEELYGADAIKAFRQARVVNFSDRKTVRETIVTFGEDLAIGTVEFTVTVNGAPRYGRQGQVWVRFPDMGWKIVSAHVSHKVVPANTAAFGQSVAGAYAAAAAAFLDMPVDPAFAPGVTNDLTVMAKVAAPLMALNLPDVEPAGVFRA